MKSVHQLALGPLVLLFLALAPASAMASKTATVARAHDVVYHDRTPRVHDETPKQQHHHHHNKTS
jgi:hypothetical protein